MDGAPFPSTTSVTGENSTVFRCCLLLGLLAVGFDKYGSEEKLLEDPIVHLFEVYVKINVFY